MATESNLLWLWLNILSGYVKWEYWCESFKDWWEVVTTIFSDPGVKKKELFVWVTEAVARVYWCQGPVRRGQGGHVGPCKPYWFESAVEGFWRVGPGR